MTPDGLDTTIWLAGVSMELVLLALLVHRRIFRVLPIFFVYSVCCLGSEAACWFILRYSPGSYLRFYLVDMTADFLFQFAILAELAASVLRHNRGIRAGRVLLALLMALSCTLLWFLAKWVNPSGLPLDQMLYVILLQAFAVLRVAAMLAIVWWSSLQGLQWPERELRVASGLGFYSVVCLAVIVLHTHNMDGTQYHWLDQIQAFSYFCVLSYWVLFFAKKEPNRRNIRP